MASLARFYASNLVGFFSYSREDDSDFNDVLSKFRFAIQAELGAQLGRNRDNFRIWQDKFVIPHGTLWQKQITDAVNQSAFFIPIITPRVVNSPNCAFEFESFVARERQLGRDDLVFPILYIQVPELDDGTWQENPVLKLVKEREYLDWRNFRYRSLESPEVAETIGSFCRSIANALRKSWLSSEERRQVEEAKRRAEEDQQQRQAEARAQQQAREEEKARRLAAEAKRRADEEEARRVETEARKKPEAEKEAAPWRALSPEQIARAEELANWDFIKASENSQFFRDHLVRFPEGVTERMARTKLEALVWAGLPTPVDVSSLKGFLEEFPDGAHAGEAKSKLAKLERKRGQTEAAALISSLKGFLKESPASAHAGEAKSKLAETERKGGPTEAAALIRAVVSRLRRPTS
jgi:flagellar biosynthesis GTPase FlhF